MNILSRTFSDTFSKRLGQLFSASVAGLVGWLYLYFAHGEDFALSELPFVIGAIVGTATFVVVLFVWNLACAPYRIEKDKVVDLEKRLESAVKAIAKSPLPNPMYRTFTSSGSDLAIRIDDALRTEDAGIRHLTAAVFAHHEASKEIDWPCISIDTTRASPNIQLRIISAHLKAVFETSSRLDESKSRIFAEKQLEKDQSLMSELPKAAKD